MFIDNDILYVSIIIKKKLRDLNYDKTNRMACAPSEDRKMGIRPVWSKSSLCAQWVTKDLNFLHVDSEDADQTGRMLRLIWVFADHTGLIVGFVGLIIKKEIESSWLINIEKFAPIVRPNPIVIKVCSCSVQLSMKFSQPINMKMPIIVGIFIFTSWEIFMFSYVQQERICNF